MIRWIPFIILLTACEITTTEEVERSAIDNAVSWCKDMTISCLGASCSGKDSDLDGYTSCTVSTSSGERIPLECGYTKQYAFAGQNTGCKEVKTYTVPIK